MHTQKVTKHHAMHSLVIEISTEGKLYQKAHIYRVFHKKPPL